MNVGVERLGQRVLCVRIPAQRTASWEQSFLLTSDEHIDSPHCDRRLLRRHMQQALDREAGHLGFGDTFDLMQGREDRRRSLSDLDPKLKETTYRDQVLELASDFYEPFSQNMLQLSLGNHETKFTQAAGTCMVQSLVDSLELRARRAGRPVPPLSRGAYTGWVLFRLVDGRKTQTVKLYYSHGSGGGGPVTRGVIQTNRRAVVVPDADIVVSGHIHEAWMVEVMRESVLRTGKVVDVPQYHIQLPTYKKEWVSGEGWHVETEKPPKPLGGWWLKFYWNWEGQDWLYSLVRTER